MIHYLTSPETIIPDMLTGFFVDWPNPPSPESHLAILRNSRFIVLALDPDTTHVVGFINALSDGILAAYIPLLEVLPAYQHQGIGTQLVKHLLAQTAHLYMVDTTCDPHLQRFYAKCGMTPATAMIHRNHQTQSAGTL